MPRELWLLVGLVGGFAAGVVVADHVALRFMFALGMGLAALDGVGVARFLRSR